MFWWMTIVAAAWTGTCGLDGAPGAESAPARLAAPAPSDRTPVPPAKVDVAPVAHDSAIKQRLERILTATGWFDIPGVEVHEGRRSPAKRRMGTGPMEAALSPRPRKSGAITRANSPRDMLSRLETMVLMAGVDLPVRAIREQIASAVDLIVHQARLKDGSRKVVAITEVQGMEGDVIVMQDIFKFEQYGIENGKILGRLQPTGIRPKFTEKLEASGIQLPPEVFGFTGDRRRR